MSSIAAGRGPPRSRCAPLCLPTSVVNIIKTIPECLTAEAESWPHCRGRRAEARNSDGRGTPRALNREGNKQQGGLQNTACHSVSATAQLPDEQTIWCFRVPLCSSLSGTLISLRNVPRLPEAPADALGPEAHEVSTSTLVVREPSGSPRIVPDTFYGSKVA